MSADASPESSRIAPRIALEALVALIFWGSVPVVIRHVAANPFTIGIVRLILASSLIYLLFVRRAELRGMNRRDWLGLALIGLCFGLHWLMYFFSIKIASASIGAMGLAGYGAFLILLSALVNRRMPGPLELVAVALCIAGSLLLIPEFNAENQIALGLLLGAGSAFGFACLPILHRRFRHLGSGVRAMGQFAFALPVFLVGVGEADYTNLPASEWWWLAYLTIFCTVVGHGLWIRVTTALPPTTTSTVYYLYLPISLSFAHIFLGEMITAQMLVGGVLIAGGSILGIRNQQTGASE